MGGWEVGEWGSGELIVSGESGLFRFGSMWRTLSPPELPRPLNTIYQYAPRQQPTKALFKVDPLSSRSW